MTLPKVHLYTDGSTYPTNPGHGGVGYVLIHEGKVTTVNTAGWSMGENTTSTNNWVETYAVVAGLRALKTVCDVTLFTDSTYVIHGIRRVLDRNKELLKTNEDAWQAMVNTISITTQQITVVQLAGHVPSKVSEQAMLNNLADKLAGYSARTKKHWNTTWGSVQEAYDNRPTRTTE